MKHISKQALLLLLIVFLCAQTCALTVSAAPTAGVSGTVDTYVWERVDSQDDLPESENCPVLLLYEWNNKQYMVDANSVQETEWDNSGYAHWNWQFTPTELPDGVRFGEKSFRTLKSIGNMLFSYTGRKDSDNGNAKIYTFSSTGDSDSITWQDEYCYTTPEDSEYRYITVLTPGSISDVSLKSGRVGMFANISWRSDCLVRINSDNGRVYSVRSSSWDMGSFAMYVGHKETLSSVRSDYTIGSGTVANYNGYIYIEPGVTLTVETGGVLSVSGILYNNGAIKSTGGDIVVQKGATIEQFCLDDASGGTIECDGGDLVILSGGRVITGKSADSSLGYGDGGCVFKNGATCTNFGTFVTRTSAYFLNGAAIDNRESGCILIGYSLENSDSGNFSVLSDSQANDPSTYVSTAEISGSSVYSACLLCGGTNAVLSNYGTIYLSSWMQQMKDAAGITGRGTGKITAPTWAHAASASGIWSAPAAWQSMITL